MIYFEDMVEGEEVLLSGSVTVSAEDIVEFARKYDPQPFHLSDEGAKGTLFESLAASGWHTAALTMKLLITARDEPVASLGSPGFDDLRWLRPVRPGDTLRVRTRCIDKKPSESRPQMGVVRIQVETLNQHDELVMTLTSIAMFARRSTPAAH